MVTVNDLRVNLGAIPYGQNEMPQGDAYRQATIEDLILALQAEGFVVRKPESKSQAKRIAIQQGRCCE